MLEVFAVLFLLTVIVITVIVAIVVRVFDKKETEELRKEAEAKKEKEKETKKEEEQQYHERLAASLSLIYILHNRNLAACFDSVGFYYTVIRHPEYVFASISELQDKGFIKLVSSACVNYDNNGIYESTTPARYQMTESGIAFLKENYRGDRFESVLKQQPTLQQMSVEELQIEAAKKAAIEKKEMQKHIKQLAQSQQDLQIEVESKEQEMQKHIKQLEREQRALQNCHTALTWWAINEHYNRHK